MKRPLTFYVVSLYIGCFSSLIALKNIYYGAVIAASFLIVMYFTIDKRFFILNSIFYVCGVLSFILYFNINLGSSVNARVIYKKGYYCVASCSGRKIVLSGKLTEINTGEKVTLNGKFYDNRDYAKGIVGTYYFNDLKKGKNDLISNMNNIKRELYTKFRKSIGEDRAAFVMSICFGDAGYLNDIQKSEFQKLGVVHAISVSGFHMSLIYIILEGIAGIKIAMGVSLLYVIFTGAQAATLRSFIMISIMKISKVVYKNYDNISSLCLSALILILVKPYYITDIGFILSYLATLGILLYYRSISSVLWIFPSKLNESLSLTLSAQIFSLPFVAFCIGNFSMGFLLGNIVLLPLYSAVIIAGNISLILYKVEPLFKISINVLKLLLTANDGASYMLLKVCPPIISINYKTGIAFMSIYFSYVMYKHKYYVWKWFPMFIALFLFISNYAIFPGISFIKIGGTDGIYLRYRNKSIMVFMYDTDKVEGIFQLKDKIRADKIISNPTSGAIVKLSNNMNIRILGIDRMQISFRGKKYAINNAMVKSKKVSITGRYGIIESKINNYYIFMNRLIRIP